MIEISDLRRQMDIGRDVWAEQLTRSFTSKRPFKHVEVRAGQEDLNPPYPSNPNDALLMPSLSSRMRAIVTIY